MNFSSLIWVPNTDDCKPSPYTLKIQHLNIVYYTTRTLPLFSCLETIEAGADIVLLYGHLVPKLALNVLTELAPLPSDWDKASCALCSFLMKISLFISVFRKSKIFK